MLAGVLAGMKPPAEPAPADTAQAAADPKLPDGMHPPEQPPATAPPPASGVDIGALKAKHALIKNVIAQFGGAGKDEVEAGAAGAAALTSGATKKKAAKRKAVGIDSVPDIYNDGDQMALLAFDGGFGGDDETYGDDDEEGPVSQR